MQLGKCCILRGIHVGRFSASGFYVHFGRIMQLVWVKRLRGACFDIYGMAQCHGRLGVRSNVSKSFPTILLAQIIGNMRSGTRKAYWGVLKSFLVSSSSRLLLATTLTMEDGLVFEV